LGPLVLVQVGADRTGDFSDLTGSFQIGFEVLQEMWGEPARY